MCINTSEKVVSGVRSGGRRWKETRQRFVVIAVVLSRAAEAEAALCLLHSSQNTFKSIEMGSVSVYYISAPLLALEAVELMQNSGRSVPPSARESACWS